MACIDVLETLETVSHTVEKIPAKVDSEIFAETPELPVTQTSVGVDLESLAGKPSTTPSKKQWNRGISIDGTSKSAASPSAASTTTPFSPAADLSSSFAASPCHLADIDEAAGEATTTKPVPDDILEALQTLAEKYAQVKKTLSGDELTTALETIACATAKALHEDLPIFDGADRVGEIESFLKAMVKPYVPVVNGELTSIGSIANVQGNAVAVGLCRFHVKGKCFDGILCRFCHLSREEYEQRGVVVRDGLVVSGRQNSRQELSGDLMRRRLKPFTPSPQKMQAPLAVPLMLPKPAPMPMPLMLPVPSMPAAQAHSSKPATKEQAGLCELLSSLSVGEGGAALPEARGPGGRGFLTDGLRAAQAPSSAAFQHAQQMQQMQQMQYMQQMQQMQYMQQMQQMQQMQYMQQMSMMSAHGHGMDASYGHWPQPQADVDPCPTVPPVASILARRPKSRRSA